MCSQDRCSDHSTLALAHLMSSLGLTQKEAISCAQLRQLQCQKNQFVSLLIEPEAIFAVNNKEKELRGGGGLTAIKLIQFVFPAKAGNHPLISSGTKLEMDPRLRGDDKFFINIP